MQALTKTELLAARAHLVRADVALARVRGIFIRTGFARGASSINTLIDRISDLIAEINKALQAKLEP